MVLHEHSRFVEPKLRFSEFHTRAGALPVGVSPSGLCYHLAPGIVLAVLQRVETHPLWVHLVPATHLICDAGTGGSLG